MVGTYAELSNKTTGIGALNLLRSWIGDNITPHHMPAARTLHQIPYDSGSCLNVSSGVHRYTFTYGNLDNQSKALYDSLVYENRLLFDQGDIADIYAKVRPNVDENLVNLALDEQRQHALQQKIRYKEIY